MTQYSGGCHCGAVRYEVELELGSVMACNCSICSRTGSLLAFVPASAFTLLQGEDALRDYQFNTNNVHHLFCQTCGIRSFTWGTGRDGSKMYSINVRCLDEVAVDGLDVEHFDGKSL